MEAHSCYRSCPEEYRNPYWRCSQRFVHPSAFRHLELSLQSTLSTADDRLTRTEVLLELTSVLQLASMKIEELVKYDKSRNTFVLVGGVLGAHGVHIAARSNPYGIVLIKSEWACESAVFSFLSLNNSLRSL